MELEYRFQFHSTDMMNFVTEDSLSNLSHFTPPLTTLSRCIAKSFRMLSLGGHVNRKRQRLYHIVHKDSQCTPASGNICIVVLSSGSSGFLCVGLDTLLDQAQE